MRQVRTQGFGTANLDAGPVHAALCNVARSVADSVRAGVTYTDAAVTLFDTSPRPTFQQCQNLVSAAVEHLAPELANAADGRVAGRQITLLENLDRQRRSALVLEVQRRARGRSSG